MFLQLTKFNSYYPYTHRSGAIYWSVINLSGVTPIKKADFHFLFSCLLSFIQLSIARGGAFEPLPSRCWNVVLLDLGWAKHPTSEFVSIAVHHARRYCFSLGHSSFSLIQLFSPLSRIFIHKGMLNFCQGPFFITWNVLMIFDLESTHVCLYWIYLYWTSCAPGVMSAWSC